MGGMFTKILDPPVSVNEWDSLQREAIQIRMTFVGLIQDIEKWSICGYEQKRYSTIRLQWQTVYPMLLHMIQKDHVRDKGECIEWCKQMKQEMDRLAERYLQLHKTIGDEKEEPLLENDITGHLMSI